ncbi:MULTISPECIES: hypothetical protein [Geobacter]|uniref:hypothetical protein n=1 Tax=Geobacter TaxID=28231 RepID=UPI0025745CC0|nr:hypothetical protein [Geobacter sulfurreducens]BEH10919.1 hypothetical protein GSUET_25310 [Geobacter sulfurreducens subsp. ethanolicus]BET58763.1 hypothetical protein GEO60473_18030 [Geobacter sp. 60473]HML79777.1 hypothetical protein [Geobacter sulfurreducens]
MADRHDLRVIPLRCPDCGGGLTAAGEDVIFPCRRCGTFRELEGETLALRQVLHAAGPDLDASPGARRTMARLPFWVFPFRVASSGGEATTLRNYLSLTGTIMAPDPARAEKPPLVFVPAFAAKPAPILRAGRLLTLRAPAFGRSAGSPAAVAPIVFREADALTLAEPVVLATVAGERRVNQRFLETFSVRCGTGKLLTIPFDLREGRLFQPDLDLEI